jgi:hypothetical protein
VKKSAEIEVRHAGVETALHDLEVQVVLNSVDANGRLLQNFGQRPGISDIHGFHKSTHTGLPSRTLRESCVHVRRDQAIKPTPLGEGANGTSASQPAPAKYHYLHEDRIDRGATSMESCRVRCLGT